MYLIMCSQRRAGELGFMLHFLKWHWPLGSKVMLHPVVVIFISADRYDLSALVRSLFSSPTVEYSGCRNYIPFSYGPRLATGSPC